MEVATGTMLGGYRVERKLGQGGMGVVYLAHQVSLDRPVALKLIAPGAAEDEAFRRRFLTESRLAASIDHPNVIPVHEASEADGRLFVAMRYVDGPDLAALLRAERRLEPARAAAIVAQVAAALDAAHARGLVHRDVKPANVLVADPGGAEHCYLTDFGLVKRTASTGGLTMTGQVMGTASYIAPEQLRGGTVDARADVYALGCVLFQLLTGRTPFERDTDVAVLWAHLSEVPPSPSDFVPSTPRALDAVVARGLAKDPGDRYPTAGALGDAAVSAARPVEPTEIGTLPPAVPPATDGTTASPRRRRLRRWAPAVVVAAVVAVGVTIAVVVAGGDEPPPQQRAGAPALRVAAEVAVGGVPLTGSMGHGRVWVTLDDEDRLAVIDPATGAVSETRPYGHDLAATAVSEDRLWVGDPGRSSEDGTGAVVEVDPDSGRVVRRIPAAEPYRMEAGEGAVWLTDLTSTVQRLDTARGRVTAERTVERAFDVALAAGRAWVVANGDGELVPFDADTGRPAGRPVAVGARPLGVAAAAGALWVVTEPGRLVRVDPASRRTEAFAIGPADPTRIISATDERLWLVDAEGMVITVDPERPDRPTRLELGGDLYDVVPSGRGAFVLGLGTDSTGVVVRVEPAAGR